MIEQNRAEFERCRIAEYHVAGRLGQGKTIVVLDDNLRPLPFMDYVEYPLGSFETTGQHHSTKVIRVIHEVAPEARIVSLPYINEATTQQKNDSIQWILDHRDEIDIINCSFHEFGTSILQRLGATKIPVVCAAGNQGYEGKVPYPARYPWTIAVGALEEYRDAVAGYSNAGPELDCICYTKIFIPTTKGVMEFSGTSAAAPMLTGMLALTDLKTGIEAKEFIRANCIDYYEPGHDWKSGYGLFVLPKLEDDIVGVNKPTEIIIHHSLTKDNVTLKDFDAIKRYHMQVNGWSDIGYHWVLEKANGKWGWYPGRPEKVSGAHTKEQGMNYKSIGLCVVGNFDAEIPTDEIYQLVAEKCKLLMGRYQITAIEGHRKYATYKSCPGKNFSLDEVRKRVFAKEAVDVAGFEGPAKVVFRGKEFSAGILGGKTYVELRALAELLGLKVYWDNATKTVTLS